MTIALIFRLELPLRLAPTMNVYSSMKRRKWSLGNLNREVDGLILQAKLVWHSWKMDGLVISRAIVQGKAGPYMKTSKAGGVRRLVRCTRHSSAAPDEIGVDIIGGKLPLDRLVQANVLRDDNAKWCAREASWLKAPPKKGLVVIEVYDL